MAPFAKLGTVAASAERDAWLVEADECDVLATKTFAAGQTDDGSAICGTLSTPCSSKQTKGQVNRPKPIKRQMQSRQPKPMPQPLSSYRTPYVIALDVAHCKIANDLIRII